MTSNINGTIKMEAATVREVTMARKTTIARDLMTPEVLTVREDMAVANLAEFLVGEEITGAVVVDEDGRPTGVVSLADIAASAVGQAEVARSHSNPDFYVRSLESRFFDLVELQGLHLEQADLLVKDIMSPAVYSVPETATLIEVIEEMLGGHVHRLVVTQGNELVGIISSTDLLKVLLEREGEEAK